MQYVGEVSFARPEIPEESRPEMVTLEGKYKVFVHTVLTSVYDSGGYTYEPTREFVVEEHATTGGHVGVFPCTMPGCIAAFEELAPLVKNNVFREA